MRVTYVEVVDPAPVSGEPTPLPYEAEHKYVVQVPPYPKPLASAPDARQWWAEHRPLVLQTEALGPLKDRQMSFAGFRVLSVKADVIDKIHFIGTQRLHERGYQLPWEEAIAPTPRRYHHIQRSRLHDAPDAAGVPCGYLSPAAGMQNIVYRDSRGRMIELWRDANGATGTGNLTAAAHDAPIATGDPYVYLETPTGLQVVLYRGTDGHVNSLYWSTGDVGFDHLTSSVGAPKAAGNPVGYFESAANINHVIYRKADDHLHELWWTGQQPVSHGDITGQAGALRATGDPSVMLDTARGDHIVAYRATDGHIHTAYWSTGPIGHENLSGFARAPKASGGPHAYYTAHNDMKQIVYRGVDGHIHELLVGRHRGRQALGLDGHCRRAVCIERPGVVLQRRDEHETRDLLRRRRPAHRAVVVPHGYAGVCRPVGAGTRTASRRATERVRAWALPSCGLSRPRQADSRDQVVLAKAALLERSLLTTGSGRFPVRGYAPLLSRIMDDQGERTPERRTSDV